MSSLYEDLTFLPLTGYHRSQRYHLPRWPPHYLDIPTDTNTSTSQLTKHIAFDYVSGRTAADRLYVKRAMRRSNANTLDIATTVSSPDTNMSNTQKSPAWIAGPVIGAVVGLTILLLASWFLFRLIRKRRRPKGHELNGEPALILELEHKKKPQELNAQEQDRSPVELAT
ncbi:hypothetical protein RRF57_013412 [Xylaria bambusicola]|uniref:Uncharacterized protein n=1 Tax=Xylaria bambusicola TaxID=326684 RepID=A0AAN7ZBL3_9PEZI